MTQAKRLTFWCWLFLLLGLQTGCAGLSPVRKDSNSHRAFLGLPLSTMTVRDGSTRDGSVVLVSAQVQPASEASAVSSSPLAGAAELQVEALIEAVLARNPSLAQMAAAWQAASARYPQVTALDDPMFGATLGPGSIGSDDVNIGYRLEISQKFPWPGKRALRGENALAEAGAAGRDVEDMRLQLIESARQAFYDYQLAEQALGVNEESRGLLKDFRANALERFRTGQAVQQDVLQADVEIGRQRERQLTLERMRQVAIARINTLMHLPTNAPLPPPAGQSQPAEALADVRELQARALALRPDLQALQGRIAAENAALALAYKEYYPDLEPFVMYDRFMGNMSQERDLATQIGVRLNLPIRKDRRAGAVAEAQARLAQRQAELARLTDQINFQVEEAYQQVRESERAIRLYDETILPAAGENVKAALAAYGTGKVPFLSLIEAQRNLVSLRERYYETSADVWRRRATLERVTGETMPAVATGHIPQTGAR